MVCRLFLQAFGHSRGGLGVALLLALAHIPAYACPTASDVVAHLAPVPARARPGDILNYAHELTNPADREKFTALIRSARGQRPALRGIEIYERVVLSALVNGRHRQAILDTPIPTRGLNENVVLEMIDQIRERPACETWSLCGSEGRQALENLMEQIRLAPHLRQRIREGIDRNAAAVMQARADLLSRLREARSAGSIRYEDLVRESMLYAATNIYSLDIRSLARRVANEGNVRVLYALERLEVDALTAAQSETTRLIENAEDIFGAVIVPSTRPFSEMEITAAGHLLTPIEISSDFSFADQILYSPLGNAAHDSSHRRRIIQMGEGGLENIDSQIALADRWAHLDRLRSETSSDRPDVSRELEHEVHRRRHERYIHYSVASIYFSGFESGLRLTSDLRHYVEQSPEWRRVIEAEFDQGLAAALEQDGISSATEISASEGQRLLSRESSHLYRWVQEMGIQPAIDAQGQLPVLRSEFTRSLVAKLLARLGLAP